MLASLTAFAITSAARVSASAAFGTPTGGSGSGQTTIVSSVASDPSTAGSMVQSAAWRGAS